MLICATFYCGGCKAHDAKPQKINHGAQTNWNHEHGAATLPGQLKKAPDKKNRQYSACDLQFSACEFARVGPSNTDVVPWQSRWQALHYFFLSLRVDTLYCLYNTNPWNNSVAHTFFRPDQLVVHPSVLLPWFDRYVSSHFESFQNGIFSVFLGSVHHTESLQQTYISHVTTLVRFLARLNYMAAASSRAQH